MPHHQLVKKVEQIIDDLQAIKAELQQAECVPSDEEKEKRAASIRMAGWHKMIDPLTADQNEPMEEWIQWIRQKKKEKRCSMSMRVSVRERCAHP